MAKVSAKKRSTSKIKVNTTKKALKNLKLPKWDFSRKNLLKTLAVVAILFFSFSLVDLLVQYLNNDYSMAVVNGSRIPKSEFYTRLEKAYGQASVTLIEEELIKQEASKSGVNASEDEINQRISDIEAQIGGKEALDSALLTNNITIDDLRSQIRIDILVTKILEPEIKYTDEDLKEFFDSYKGALYPNEEVTFEDKKEELEETYVKQQIENKRVEWVEKLKADSRIQNNVLDKPSYGFLRVTSNIFNNLLGEVEEGK